MSRQIRMVPAKWEHPKNKQGYYIPLHDGFNKRLADWEEENEKWSQGLRRDYLNNGQWVPIDKEHKGFPFEDWDGPRPDPKNYMPDFPPSERTHMCMYEECTEGTPISPPFKTPEELARWLTDNEASAFGNMTATYEQWLATCKKGYAIALCFGDGLPIRSGVELNADGES